MSEGSFDVGQFEPKPVFYYFLKLDELVSKLRDRLKKSPVTSSFTVSEKLSNSLTPEEREVYNAFSERHRQGRIIEEKYPEREWKKEGFDLRKAVALSRGPVIEVAGPTRKGYSLIKPGELKGVKKNTFVSNIQKGAIEYSSFVGDKKKIYRKVNFMADGRFLPLIDNSVGVLFCSCLDFHLRKQEIKEALRVIEPGGLYIFQGIMAADIGDALEEGLEIKQYNRYYFPGIQFWDWNVIFQKKAD